MPINPNIALSAVPVKIDVPDPMEMYARMAQVQQARNQNALAQYQLGKAQREDEQTRALNALYAGAVTPEGNVDYNKLIAGAGQQGMGSLVPGFLKGQREAAEAQAKADKEFGAAVEQRLKLSREMLSNVTTPEEFMALHEANHKDPVLKKFFDQLGITAESARPGIEKAIAAGPEAFQELLYRSRASADSLVKNFEERRKPMSVAAGGSVYNPVTGTFTQAPAALAAPTTFAKLQTERAALPPGDPRIAQYDALILKETTHAPSARTTVSLPPQEKAEQGKRGEFLVDQYKALSNAAGLASRTLPALETQERLLTEGFKTGFGTEAQKAGASVLAALGIPEASKFATDAQTFLSATQQAVLQRQLEQKGPQTEADAQRITQTGAQLGNTPEANKFMIAVAKAQLKRDIEQRNFYDKWWKTNKTYDGAEDAWFTGEGGKSLFDRPELKQYAAPAKPAPAAAPPATTGIQPFSDAAKERRYQEWKRSRGTP